MKKVFISMILFCSCGASAKTSGEIPNFYFGEDVQTAEEFEKNHPGGDRDKEITVLEKLMERYPNDLKLKNRLSYEYFIKAQYRKSWEVLHLAYIQDPTLLITNINMFTFAQKINDKLNLIKRNAHETEVWELIGFPNKMGRSVELNNVMVHEYDEVQFLYSEGKLIGIVGKETSPAYPYYSPKSNQPTEHHRENHSL